MEMFGLALVIFALACVLSMWKVVAWIGAKTELAEEQTRKLKLENDALERKLTADPAQSHVAGSGT